MRIAFFSWEARYACPVGGVAVCVSDLAAALAGAGHEVHIFSRQGQGESLYDLIGAVHYHRCPYLTEGSFLIQIQQFNHSLMHYFQETAGQYGAFDWVHAHDWLVFQAGEAAADLDIRLALTFHSTEWGRTGLWPEHGDPLQISQIERSAIHRSSAIIPVSHDVRRQLDLLYQIPDWKTHVVYHGISTAPFDRFARGASGFREHIGLPPESPYLLFVGRLDHRKGADLLLAAAPEILRHCPGSHIVFAGSGPQEDHFRHEAHRLGLGEHSTFLPKVTAEDVQQLFVNAHAIVIPYRYDAYGQTALCAWAAARPVLVAGDGAASEFLYHGTNGYRTSIDPLSIAEHASSLLKDNDLSDWMGRNGRVAVETAFSWERVAEQTLQAYDRFVSIV